MTTGGMRIGLKGTSAILDKVIGIKDGSVRLQTQADLGTQLMSSGPLANLLATTAGNVVFFATLEDLDAAVDYSAPQAAWVFADDDPANNGAYYFTNGDPGFWTFMLNFPASWVYATISGGDANAIELAMSATVSQSTMIFFEVQDDNLAGGVTISVNGGLPMDALDFRGIELEAGALSEGALAMFFPLGDGTARMVIDNTAEAAKASAALSASSAQASALSSSDSSIAAAASATSAQRFAVAPEDEETSVGSGLYSAFHWAQKAMSVVLGALAAQFLAATTKATPDSADVFAFVDGATSGLRKFTWANLVSALGATSLLTGKLDKSGGTMTGDIDLDGFDLLNPANVVVTDVASYTAPAKKQARANIEAKAAPDAIILQLYASGTKGGTLTASTWTIRDLNTRSYDPANLISLAAPVFTPSVDGRVEWEAVGYACNIHQTRLWNVTDGVAVGQPSISLPAVAGTTGGNTSIGGALVTGGKSYRLEHNCQATKALNGQGDNGSFGDEIYARVRFWKD
jgi:hypothetical protein